MKTTRAVLTTVSILGAIAVAAGCGSTNEDDASQATTGGSATGGSGGAGAQASGGVSGGAGDSAGGSVNDGTPTECFPESCTLSGEICFVCPEAPSPELPGVRLLVTNGGGGETAVAPRTEAGKACLSGTSATQTVLAFVYGDGEPALPPDTCHGGNQWSRAFLARAMVDLEALGVTAIQFTLESPPPSGVKLEMLATVDSDQDTDECVTMQGFAPFDGYSEVVYTEGTTATVQISDFAVSWGPETRAELDLSRFVYLQFSVGVAEDFDFCVTELKLLDADGNEVVP